MPVGAVKSPAKWRVLLRNASWGTYERLIDEREERRVPRFFYDRGVLEIMSPSAEHDRVSRVVALLVEDFSRGFEPDESFYFSANAQSVQGKANIDLDAGDLPPDLVFEADVAKSSLDKLPIYARLGVPEVWRYAGGGMEILLLNEAGEGYVAGASSRVLPPLTADVLTRFVEGGLTGSRPAWVRSVRSWTRGQGD